MSGMTLNDQVYVTSKRPQEAAARLTEQRDAAAYVARHARDDADRDLLMAALGLATPAGAALLAAASFAFLALGRRIQTGGHRA